MNKEKRKKLFGLFFLLLFLTSINLSLLTLPVFATTQGENLSVEYGDNVFQYIPYTYAGTFYDDADYKFAYSDVDIEFTYIPDPTVNTEYPVTDSLTNSESLQAFGEQNFTFNEGSGQDYENMMSEDSVYTNFNRTGVGHYNATYSFENDLDGSEPSGWTSDNGVDCTTTIKGELDGHNKILDLYDNHAVDRCYIHQTFIDGAQTIGTIELWVYTTSITDYALDITLRDSTTQKITITIHDTKWKTRELGGAWTQIPNVGIPVIDTWTHFEIIFDCTTDKSHIIIDGVDSGELDFLAVATDIDNIQIYTYNFASYHVYIDAIDYSWDTDYIEGRNREDLDPLGHFPATYSFINDVVWTNPTGWYILEGSGCDVSVISNIDNHNKILELRDEGAGACNIYQEFTYQSSGTIEFWVRINTTNKNTWFYLRNVGDVASSMRFNSVGQLQYRQSGGAYIYIQDYIANQWYHFSWEFDCLFKTFDIYIDGILKVDDGTFQGNYDSINRFQIYTDGVDLIAYLDAIGYSFDENYLLGDNLNDNFYLGSETFEQYNQTTEGDYYGTETFDYKTEEGVYYGTHDFRDDADGSVPTGWTDNSGDDCSLQVISDYEGHKKVLEFDDGHLINRASGTVEFTLGADTIVEFWISRNVSNTIELHSYEGTTQIYNLVITSAYFTWYNGTWNTFLTQTLTPTVWYHIRITHDDTMNTADIYLNNVLVGDDLQYQVSTTTGISKYLIQTHNNNQGYCYYIDAFGFSTDITSHDGLGYTVGYNINAYDIVPLLENDINLYRILCGSSVSIDNIEGHDNSLNITGIAGDYIKVYKDFSQQTSGTIDFWYYQSTASTNYIQITQDYATGSGVWMNSGGGTIQYFNGTDWNTILSSFIQDQWYHFRVDFDCISDTFNVWLNGTQLSDDYGTTFGFRGVVAYINCIGSYIPSLTSVYYDGIGYSWDSNYDVGDNINSHGKEVITALESEGWTFTNYALNSIGISGEFNSHKKFINLTDGSSTRGDYAFSETFSETSGTIEFYFKQTDTSKISYFILRTSVWPDQIGMIRIDGGGLIKWAGDIQTTLQSWLVDTWYHIKIDFECGSGGYMGLSADTVDIYINDILKGDGLNFETATDTLYQINLLTHTTQYGYSVYFDSISYSWEEPETSYFSGSYNQHCNVEALLDFVVEIPFDNYDKENLYVNITSVHFSNTFTNISLNLYNHTSNSWQELYNTVNIVSTKNEIIFSSADLSGFFGSSGIQLRYYAYNHSSFWFKADLINVSIWFKTELNYEHTLNLLGTWKYRFKIDVGEASEYVQDWVYFNLIEQKENFEGVSESPYTTKWQLTSSSMSSNYEQKYQDLMGTNYWSLTGTSNPVIYYSENPEDAYVDNYYTTSNYGSTTTLGTYYEDTDYGYQYVLPNTNSGPNDWHSEYSASNHWMAVDEYTSLDGHENWADGTDDGQIEEYGMSTFTMAIGSGVGTITSVTARFYTSSNAAFEDDYSGDIRIYLGGWLSSKIMVFDILFGGSWYEQTWSGLSASQADLDGMLVECTAPGVIDPTDVHRLWSVYVKVYYSLSSTRTRETYIKSPISYLLDNVTANSKLTTYISSGTYPTTINPYETSDFTESTITNTNKPASIGSALGSTVVSSSSSPKDIDLGSIPLNYYVLKVSSTASDNGFVIYSSEYGTTGYRPLVKHYISKVYQDLSSKYIYMQANESESLGLKCQAFGTDVSLSSDNSDFFGLYLQSNTQDVYLKLYNDGDLQDTITVLENNVVTTVQYVEVSVDSDVSFDQVEIYSLLNDEEYVKLFNITAEGYTFDAQEQTTTFYVDPDGSKEVVIPTIGDADLKVYDNGILRHEETISLTTELTTVIYVREVESIININYFDSNGDYLYFNDFKTYVNYTLDEVEYNDKRLASNFLYVDSGSNVEITVYDSFDYPIISNSYPEQKFLDLELDVYELKIKNERLNPVSYSLENDDINTTKTGSLFENEILTLKIASGEYNFNYLESGESEWKEFSFALINNQYFVLNRSQICFLSYTNQRGEYLNFNQFKTYWNGTLLYENVFYEDIGNNVSIEIKDHYDISVQNHSFIVSSGDNYIPVVLTMYSLKVMSQQLCFNHINITRDPNYYDSDYFWSEWIAPSEIIEFELFAGYYKINLTNNEAGSSNLYSYALNGDDILLISSDNTIYNVLLNIANVNTTIGNQITNVQIDLTNQNSNINNSIINIDINLGTINSTLGNMLVNLDVDITNIANNISNLYTFTENSFVNLGNNINASFICIENNIISINQSISNLVIGVSNNILLVNGTISTMISSLETNLLLMNVSIDTALFDLDTTVVEIGNNITNNYILLNNSITLGNNNINDSRIAIINNLALINNTMSNLISTVYSSVYMINNSIYTAVVDVGTSLMLINNSISGNLSIILEMNDALTELYRKTMFSSLLNWTNIGYNTSLITSQIDSWDFINHYKNQSIEIHLRYQDIVDKLVVTANNYKTQYLPAYDTDYNLWSVKDQKYLDTWEPLPDNRTVPFGFYEADIPTDPEPIINTFWTYLIVVVFFAGLSFGMLKLYYGTKERKNEVPAELVNLTSKPHKKKQKGVVDNRL